MDNNLVEFLCMLGLVTGSTSLIIGFRLMIIFFDRKMNEYIESRQPMLEAMKARLEEASK
tara:strand:- start:477 stop:656 length:180 start_codon:yes stop_codon:yes gene_type:complete